MSIRLRVRANASSHFIENFSNYGWKVRDATNTVWVQMAPANTKVRNAANTAWVAVK